MLTYITGTTLFLMISYLCYSVNKLNKDMRYIRLTLEELESSVKDCHWVVYDGYKQTWQCIQMYTLVLVGDHHVLVYTF